MRGQTFIGLGLALVACVGDTPTTPASDSGTDAPVTDAAMVDASDSGCGDTMTSPNNCGACGHVCDGGSCFEGVCGGNAIVQVSSGGESACALTLSGSVYCWGRDTAKTLGTGAVDSQCDDFGAMVACQPTPTRIVGLDHIVQVTNNGNSACALRATDHAVLCWGGNGAGQTGHDPGTNGDSVCSGAPCNATPVVVAGLADAKEVHVGDAWACALTTAGKVKCWGRNDYGNLGQKTVNVPPTSSSPLEVQGLSNVSKLAVSENSNACAIVSTDGSAWCWGNNQQGALGHSQSMDSGMSGNGTAMPTYAIDQKTALTGFSAVSTGGGTCLIASGVVSCDGIGFVAQLATPGQSTFTPQTIPGVAQAVSVVTDVEACALLSNGHVTCWGDNENGALGRGTVDTTTSGFTAQNAPKEVAQLEASQLSAARNAVLALTTEGKVLAWGTNGAGQLGHVPGTNGDVTCYANGVTSHPIGYCGASPQPVVGLP